MKKILILMLKSLRKDNKPVYEENNMKKKESTPYTPRWYRELMNIYPLITYFINNLLKVKEDIHEKEKKRKELDYKTRLAIAFK